MRTLSLPEPDWSAERAALRERAATAEAARHHLNRVAERARAQNYEHAETMAAWHEAVDVFWSALDAAYPLGFWELIGDRYERLNAGEPAAVELAVRFLEANTVFYRSGYVKSDLLRRLRRLELAPAVADRLRAVVLQIVDQRDCREFRRYCQLAHALASPDLLAALRERKHAPDAAVRRRAEWMLAAVEHRQVDADLMQAQTRWYHEYRARTDANRAAHPNRWLVRRPRHDRYGYGGQDGHGGSAPGGWRDALRRRVRRHGRPERPAGTATT